MVGYVAWGRVSRAAPPAAPRALIALAPLFARVVQSDPSTARFYIINTVTLQIFKLDEARYTTARELL